MASEQDIEPREILLQVIRKDWGAVSWIEERITREQQDEGAENTNVRM